MEPIKVYAIRQISTGWFMPATAPQRHRQRGYTRDEPTERCVPRLFLQRKYAKLALRAWLKGAWIETHAPGDYHGQLEPTGMEIVPVEGRKSEDMEIVQLIIVEAAT